jgi:hypothetical protein
MQGDRAYVYVFNDGGRFKFKNVVEKQQIGPVPKQASCEHCFVQTASARAQRCSGCARTDLTSAAKCEGCSFSLCSLCARANLQGFPTVAHASTSLDVEEKFEESLPSPRPSAIQPHSKGLFPTNQTIHLAILSSGPMKDLKDRLQAYVNSKLDSFENQVESIVHRDDLDRAWVVFKTPAKLNEFKTKCQTEPILNLLDGWMVRWRVYLPPVNRRVYRVVFASNSPAATVGLTPSSRCTMVRRCIEDQLKMSAADVDLVAESDGELIVIFSHGEFDVDFARVIFFPNGQEASIVPTVATV